METAERLFERAKRLKPEEISRLVALLEGYLLSESDKKRAPAENNDADFLALSGIGESDFTDVSSHKAKHLAHAYGPRRGD